jgi:hypothetical protein
MTDTKNQPKAATISAVRKRRMTAAMRSLTLVRGVVDQHLGLLKSGQVPESDFVTSGVKYAQALGELRLLDMIAEGGEPAANGTIELERADVAALLETLGAFVPQPVLAALPPLARVAEAAADPEPGTAAGSQEGPEAGG